MVWMGRLDWQEELPVTIGCEGRQLSGKILGRAICLSFAGLMLVAGCNSAPPPVDRQAAEDAVRAADGEALKAAQALDAAGTASYYTEDAMVMPPNAPGASGRVAAQKAWAAMLVPGTEISWLPNKVEAAASGEMVYDQGTYSLTTPGPDGKPVNDDGKYLSVWKKQADGDWKEVEDIWNSDVPVAAPVAAAKTR
jgi:ketosteroid isomerase-like protein